jgi:peptidoglycan L-alanyl-D-glutamate endopeptidase CwlK
VHPDLFGWSSAQSRSRSTTSGSRQVLRTRERHAALVARGASRTMRSRHLAGHAVDLVALGGSEISW